MTDTVTRATNIFSLATKNSCLVATLVTRFLYDLDLNLKLKQIFHLPNRITKASLPLCDFSKQSNLMVGSIL